MEKKEIKIKFVNFWPFFNSNTFFLKELLEEKYNVIECDDPDYIICSIFHPRYEYCLYPQVRILFSGENYCPDFNLVDYGIGYDDIRFGDRYYRFGAFCSMELVEKSRDYTQEILKEKTLFANFISSHESEHAIRGNFFKKLCEYKTVSSMGSYLNNMPDNKVVSYQLGEKKEYQSQCKFTLCFESTSHRDFCTEKLVDAFLADTIPIYYGDPNVCKIFNSKAFINVADYPNYEAVLERIKELDNDDEKYLQVLREPVYVDSKKIKEQCEGLKKWLYAIFEQPLEKAYRRSRVYCPFLHERELIKKFSKDYKKAVKRSKKVSIKTKLGRKFPKLKKLFLKAVRRN